MCDTGTSPHEHRVPNDRVSTVAGQLHRALGGGRGQSDVHLTRGHSFAATSHMLWWSKCGLLKPRRCRQCSTRTLRMTSGKTLRMLTLSLARSASLPVRVVTMRKRWPGRSIHEDGPTPSRNPRSPRNEPWVTGSPPFANLLSHLVKTTLRQEGRSGRLH